MTDPFDAFGFDPEDFAGIPLFNDLRKFLSFDGDPVHWHVAQHVAEQITGKETLSLGDTTQRDSWADAVRVAESWLDPHTTLEPVFGPAIAPSSHEWVTQAAGENGIARYIEPVVDGLQTAFTDAMSSQLPEMLRGTDAARNALAPFTSLMAGVHIGTAAGHMATSLLGGYDLGLPTISPTVVSQIGSGAATLATEHDLSLDQVRFWLALRETILRRIYVHADWLVEYLTGEFRKHAAAMTFDLDELQRNIDPAMMTSEAMADPETMSRLAESASLGITPSAEQQAIAAKIQTVLSLVAGYADEVTALAAEGRLTELGKIEEITVRRRASGAPEQQFLTQLVGMHLSRTEIENGRTFVVQVLAARGPNGLDTVWQDSRYLPSPRELSDPSLWLLRLAAEEAAAGTTPTNDELPTTDVEIPDDLAGLDTPEE